MDDLDTTDADETTVSEVLVRPEAPVWQERLQARSMIYIQSTRRARTLLATTKLKWLSMS